MAGVGDWVARLTDAQVEAVNAAPDGMTLVCGGPGTGKTFVLAVRAQLLGRQGSVLVLCHQRTLLEQLEQRLHLIDPEGARAVRVSTVFGWTAEVLGGGTVVLDDQWASVARLRIQESEGPLPTTISDDQLVTAIAEGFCGRPVGLAGLLGASLATAADLVERLRMQVAAERLIPMSLRGALLGEALARGAVARPDFLLIDDATTDLHGLLESLSRVPMRGLTLFADQSQDVGRGGMGLPESDRSVLLGRPLSRPPLSIGATTLPDEDIAQRLVAWHRQVVAASSPAASLGVIVGRLITRRRLSRAVEDAGDTGLDLYTMGELKGAELDHAVLVLDSEPPAPAAAAAYLFAAVSRARSSLLIICEREYAGLWATYLPGPRS